MHTSPLSHRDGVSALRQENFVRVGAIAIMMAHADRLNNARNATQAMIDTL